MLIWIQICQLEKPGQLYNTRFQILIIG